MKDLGAIRHANGTTDLIPTCSYSRYNAKGEVISKSVGSRDNPQPSANGYLVYESVVGSSSYGSLSANWYVPSAPTSNDGQTIYFFPGLEDYPGTGSDTILQPVLEWNGLTKNAWDIASWNCCYNNVPLHSSPVTVSSGDTILGTMQSTCQAGNPSCSSWNITTEDVTSGKTTVLPQTSSYGQTFDWAFGGALEVYNVTQCSDFPPDAITTFSKLTLTNDNFVALSPSWSLTNNSSEDSTQCNYGGSATPQQVTLNYGVAMPYLTSSSWQYPYPVHHSIQYVATVVDSTPGAVITYEFEDQYSGSDAKSGTTTSGGQITSSIVGTYDTVSLYLRASVTSNGVTTTSQPITLTCEEGNNPTCN